MKHAISFFAVILATLGLQAREDWVSYPLHPEGADYELESISPSAFTLKAKRQDTSAWKTGCLAISDINRDMWTHNKVVLTVRSLNGKRVDVGVSLSRLKDGNVALINGGGVSVSGRAWRDVVLSLDQDFNMGDCSVKILQAKIGAWIGSWRTGEEGGIEVKDFRLCAANEVSQPATFGAKDTFRSVPSPARRRADATRKPAPDALKVYFAFDNEDVNPSISTRKKGLSDEQQFGGFREILLSELDGRARFVNALDEAEAIVYSRCRPDPIQASNIVAAVTQRGIPLYAAGEIADPEVEAILPCALGHDILEDFPPRARIVRAEGSPSWLSDLSDAPFGIYRRCQLRPGAKKLLRYSDAAGTPALVEGVAGKGRALYAMFTIGSSLVPGKTSPDAFFVRALGQLTGRTFPEKARPAVRPDEKGWWNGVSGRGFGRFGWETGSGLLVENVGTRFTITCGEAGYEFGFPITEEERAKGRAFTFAGDRVNQLSLGGVVAIDGTRAYRIDMSLAYPGVRWDFAVPRVEMYLKNVLARALVPLPDGPKLVDLTEGGAIPAAGWTAPWLLVFNGSEKDSPLLLVFQHRMDKLEVMRNGEALRGLAFAAKNKPVGVVVPTWIYGNASVDTSAWTNAVPEETFARIERWYPRAFRYPVDCREKFKLVESRARIAVRATYHALVTADDWHTEASPYAPLPPLVWELSKVKPQNPARMDARFTGTVAVVDREAEDRGLVTRFGNFADKDGSAHVQWALPLPKGDLGLWPHATGFPEYEKVANDHFVSAVRYTCGGWRKVDPVYDRYGYKDDARVNNCNMHGFLLGMCRNTPNPFGYNDENRRLLRRRMTWRMLEPLEAYQFKMVCRWRREPVSGEIYTIYMNSPRDISTQYEPEAYGSKIIYGDSNETVRMILHAARTLEDVMGQEGLIRANADALLRHVPSYELMIDDWAYLASGCLEYGGASCVDMLNSEYGCMMTLARVAEIAGDEALRVQALYRAARRLCPTIARLGMRDYYLKTGLLTPAAAGDLTISHGFNEQGACYHRKGKHLWDCTLFDMSQGIPEDLIAIDDWFGWEAIRRGYLDEVKASHPAGGLSYIMTAILAIGGDLTKSELRAKLDECIADGPLNKLMLSGDWLGMDTGSYLDYILARLTDAPRITACKNLLLHDAKWNPTAKRLSLAFTPQKGGALAVEGKAVTDLKVGQRQKVELDFPERNR